MSRNLYIRCNIFPLSNSCWGRRQFFSDLSSSTLLPTFSWRRRGIWKCFIDPIAWLLGPRARHVKEYHLWLSQSRFIQVYFQVFSILFFSPIQSQRASSQLCDIPLDVSQQMKVFAVVDAWWSAFILCQEICRVNFSALPKWELLRAPKRKN